MLEIEQFVVGPLENNSYLITEDLRGYLIDPGIGSGSINNKLVSQGIVLKAIILTHGHFDHIMGVSEMMGSFPDTPIYIHQQDAKMLTDPVLNGSAMMSQPYRLNYPTRALEYGSFEIEGLALEVIALPGHTPGGCGIVIENVCFTGDSLFAGSIGRTDLPGGNHQQLLQSCRDGL